MADTITRCPKCDTSFHVTEAHLNSAKGAVRCGSCLHIFNARDNLIEPPTDSPPEASFPAKSEQKPSAPPIDELDDDILISDDMEQEEEDNFYSSDMDSDMGSNVMLATTFGPSEANLFEREHVDEDEDETSDADESWAESLLDDDEDETPAKPIIKVSREAEQPAKPELFDARDVETGAQENFYGMEPPAPMGDRLANDHFRMIEELRKGDEDAPGTSEAVEPLDDDFIDNSDDIIIEQDQDEWREEPVGHAEQNDLEDNLEADLEDELEDDQAHTENGDDYLQTPFEALEYEPEIGDIDEIDDYAYQNQYGSTSNQQYIRAIEPEPVEFAFRSHYPLWHSKGLWTGLSLAAVMVLLIQITIFRFDDLSTVQPWRKVYGNLCHVFTCDLPALHDRSKIKASNLIVRSHPNIDNSLMVDAILRNTARFPQTFPPLDLVFTDIKNQAVAARRFEASEYLGGELAGKNNMPINQPVHIALEIADPGPAAVSYFITIPN